MIRQKLRRITPQIVVEMWLDKSADVPAIVMAGAGVGKKIAR